MKDLDPFKTVKKIQGASRILRMGFALSKYPHFNSAYLVKVRFSLDLAVKFDFRGISRNFGNTITTLVLEQSQ